MKSTQDNIVQRRLLERSDGCGGQDRGREVPLNDGLALGAEPLDATRRKSVRPPIAATKRWSQRVRQRRARTVEHRHLEQFVDLIAHQQRLSGEQQDDPRPRIRCFKADDDRKSALTRKALTPDAKPHSPKISNQTTTNMSTERSPRRSPPTTSLPAYRKRAARSAASSRC